MEQSTFAITDACICARRKDNERPYAKLQYLSFIFKEFCCEFFEKISKVVDVDCRYESIYVTYLGMELNACDASDRKKEGMRPSILFWIDEEHPVLSVQMDFAYPLEKLTNALDKACQWEGWKLIVRSTVENI